MTIAQAGCRSAVKDVESFKKDFEKESTLTVLETSTELFFERFDKGEYSEFEKAFFELAKFYKQELPSLVNFNEQKMSEKLTELFKKYLNNLY